MYRVEDSVRGKVVAIRLAARREHAAPIVAALKPWLEAQLSRISGKSRLAEDIRYTLAIWPGLIRFLDDGRLEIDTNPVEEQIRPIALTRKNALFAGNETGAENWAMLASLVATCKLADVNPVDYIAATLRAILDDQPVYRLLGAHSDRASIYGSGGMYGPAITPESLACEMGEAVRGGFAGVKIKGAGASLAEDVARVAAVRAAIGPGQRLMVDAMFAPSVPQAVRLARALAPFDLHFLEAPTAAADIEGWRTIAAQGGIPLSGPELESDALLMRGHLTSGAVHFLQFDAVLAGGISAGRDLAALARSFHRPVTLHCAASAVGLAASAHLAASLSNCDSVECHLMHTGLREHLWAAGWQIADGEIVIPDLPGLGLGADLDTILAAERAAGNGTGNGTRA